MHLVSRAARLRYGLDDLAQMSPARLRDLAHAINEARAGHDHQAPRVHAAELGAFLLLQEVLREKLGDTLRGEHPQALELALKALEQELGQAAVDELLTAFESEFGDGEATPRPGEAAPLAPRLAALEALLVLWHINRNPAFESLREFFDEGRLPRAIYEPAIRLLERDLRAATGGSPHGEDVIARLEAPVRQAPESIAGQLGVVLAEAKPVAAVARERVERALDALREERVRPAAGPGPVEVPQWAEPVVHRGPPRPEPAWMRELVLTAKHTHVWLDQLSRRYQAPIGRLDEVPAQELERLASLGASGLWLVGVWERSPASRTIKRLAGDSEAGASAYSVFDYEVALDLGGREAFEQLQELAAAHGLRVGVDVVPNHFGLDSRWLLEHPDYFMAVDRSPYPGYTFEGPDLSADAGVGIYLEDHYYDRSDAAVVFKHVDRPSGRIRFIYHGNDGTSTPWNDTAQLDYSLPQVREAMTELVVGLAKRFPILRFDAAMTLTRLHFQRLWFPAPGSGGAVPSRSEQGMSTADFERVMPREFWRDVVRRVDNEVPDTLLIAEAFWLMEPYFVAELGMHRVYNSAFMHLARERQNDRLGRLLRETAARDPEFLRRSVNFMSTPDEESAATQFGSDDRYFGVAAFLATLPGLPLLAHGQIEGLREKYGMEFRRPRSSEREDEASVARHRREIQPLLAERRDFATIEHFHLLEYVDVDYRTVADVHAFAVGVGEGVRIVVFNNSDQGLEGALRPAAPSGTQSKPTSIDLAALLGLADWSASKLVLGDSRVDFEIEIDPQRLRVGGLALELRPWQALVLRPAPPAA